MTALTTVAALEATRVGRAQRLTTVRHHHVDDHPFVLVPLTLAGEACAPLAALAGTDRDRPVLLAVHQPRDRAERFAFVDRLAALLLPYLDACRAETETYPAGRGKEERVRATRAPQILVPNPGGIRYVRLLGRSTRLRATSGPHAVPAAVPTLGKWLTWLADQAEFPGSGMLLSMTAALTAHWATGQSSVLDGHLGSLLAWIDPPPGQTGAEAALAAEDPAVCPPAGPATDPVFDGRTLQDLMARHDEAPPGPARALAARRIDTELRGQLAPTWDLMWRGVGLLRALPPGAHVADRRTLDRTLFTGYATHLDEDGRPQARRDHAVSAARRLARLEEAQALYDAQRAYDDPLAMAEYELTGEAFTGTVTDRDLERRVPGPSRSLWRPTVTLRTADRPRLPVGTRVTSPRRPGQETRIIEIRPAADGTYDTVLQIDKGFGRKPPAPPGVLPGLGEELTYTTLSLRVLRAPLPDDADTPWTHGGPPQPYDPTEQDAEEMWE
ncbi:hypothetical protein RKE29_21005 [Streptomyces sp. B1866]|uniref:hypothetical protein n=1 Tax=Streptomyces sp. B1866 TaxID=3075431 RepID=UPI0028928D67|nr:hypothetical protein [Streptomyces sp. B1866]MDT3399094.1 hypothetical protein [Streptomyces sp. B1866]